MRAACGATSAATGKGQTVAPVEQGLTRDMFLTLQDHAKVNHLPAPSSQRYEQLSLGAARAGTRSASKSSSTSRLRTT
jgi:hypothetical protein